MLKLKTSSLATKIFLSFFALGFFLLTILFLQIIPNFQEQERKHVVKQINSMIFLINQQLILTSLSIKNSGASRREELKSIIELEAKRIHNSIIEESDYKHLTKPINTFNSKKISCNTSIIDKEKNVLFQVQEQSFKDVDLKIDDFVRVDKKSKYVCPTGYRQFFYTKEIKFLDKYLVITCDIDKFQASNLGFEATLKDDVQKSFAQMEAFHKGKTYLMWLNLEAKNSDKPLYEKEDDYFYNEKYCISRISNLKYPKTGLLTAKEILDAVNKEPIRHFLDSKEKPGVYDQATLTWVREIDTNDDESFLYITSIYEKDFLQHIDSTLLKVLPAAILSFIVAITLALFLFKRLFKSINLLTNTAIKINKGERKLRSNIKGEDDIALLAKAFDNMLDSLEENISQLDYKVEEKTKQLSTSLREKETLLKEIHHRVKNNLAITISLIKLEKSKIENKDTKSSLTNIQERVYAMELLHRRLYESQDLSSISLNKYISELTNELQNSYSNSERIKIIKDIENINLDIEYSLPCGLIISELVTNSFKYAFINNEGEIKIHIDIDERNTCNIIVTDNGKGLDESIDINNTKSLGLQIISNIVKNQLFGDFNYIYENGAKFTASFKIDEKD